MAVCRSSIFAQVENSARSAAPFASRISLLTSAGVLMNKDLEGSFTDVASNVALQGSGRIFSASTMREKGQSLVETLSMAVNTSPGRNW